MMLKYFERERREREREHFAREREFYNLINRSITKLK